MADREETYYLVEARDGSLVRVPEQPLSRGQQLLKERILRELYGDRK